MVHRRTPGNRVAVPSGWFIVVSVAVVIVAAAWLGVLLVTGSSSSDEPPTAAPTAQAPTPESAPEPTPTPTPTPAPTSSPTPTETTEVPPVRDASVAVLNNTGIANLASRFSGQVTNVGWTVSGTGNWNGQIPSNTVYYPAGQQAAGELLAEDLGISRVLPSVAPMQTDRLTLILSGPQQ